VPGSLPRGPAFAEFLNKSRRKVANDLASRRTVGQGRQKRRATRWQERVKRLSKGFAMIGDGTHSTNQRRNTYVRDNVEVVSLLIRLCVSLQSLRSRVQRMETRCRTTDLCVGKFIRHTGHLGASTWRHVMFVEQDRQKGGQIVGSHSLGASNGEDPFAGFFSQTFASIARSRLPRGVSHRSDRPHRSWIVLVQNDVCNGCGYCGCRAFWGN